MEGIIYLQKGFEIMKDIGTNSTFGESNNRFVDNLKWQNNTHKMNIK